MVFLDRYRQGITELTIFDFLYHLLHAVLTFLWLLLVCRMALFQLYEPYMRGGLVFAIVVMSIVLFLSARSSYSAVVGHRGLITPRTFCLGYSGCLLLLLAVASLGFWWLLLVWFVVLIIAGAIQNYVEFCIERWIGEAGNFVRPEGWVVRYYRHAIKTDEPSLHWAGMQIPFKEGCRNFLLFGAISSGKTLSLRLYMQSFVPLIGRGTCPPD